MTLWASVSTKSVLALLPNDDDVVLYGSSVLREQLNINAMEGLKVRGLRSSLIETGDQMTARRVVTNEYTSARHMSVSLSGLPPIADDKNRSPRKVKAPECLLR